MLADGNGGEKWGGGGVTDVSIMGQSEEIVQKLHEFWAGGIQAVECGSLSWVRLQG